MDMLRIYEETAKRDMAWTTLIPGPFAENSYNEAMSNSRSQMK
jgi:hypothetical protein